MITIQLQKNTSENNELDKTLTLLSTVDGNLKDNTSIINPTILFQTTIEIIKDLNYLTIQSFGRSYFVKDIVCIRTNLFEVTAHVDVLTTYKNEIRNNSAIVQRNENNYNLYLNDGQFKVYQNPDIVTKEFPSGFDVTNISYILTIAGQ